MSPIRTSVASGVERITLPLELPSPDHINCYLLSLSDGGALLVDTGMIGTAEMLSGALEDVTPRPRVLITHGHVDHWGAARELADTVLAHPGVRPSLEYAAGRSVPSPDSWPAGLPAPEEMESAFGRFRSLIGGVPEIEPIGDGDRIDGWEVLWTPGHDQGHICLYRAADGVLVTGDLLLPGFTPNIQPPMDGDGDSVAQFLSSLQRVAALPIELVLPAHGEPFSDAAGRAEELIAHHDRRLGELMDLLEAGVHEVSELTEALFDGLAASEDRMLGDLETIAHLEHLQHRGLAELGGDGRWRVLSGSRPRDRTGGADAGFAVNRRCRAPERSSSPSPRER